MAFFPFSLIICGAFFLFLLKKPSNNRDWSLDQAVLPYAELNGDFVTIRNIRNCLYLSEHVYQPRFSDETYRLSELTAVYFTVVPFWGCGVGHTFLTFEFGKTKHLSISIEIRKKKNDAYSIPKSFFKQFELMYVIADEEDLMKLRILHRNNDVYIYPLNLNQKQATLLFTDILLRANSLREKPEFYHPLTNACTNNLVRHFNKVLRKKIPVHYSHILPANIDKLFHKIGLIDTPLSHKRARSFFYASGRGKKYKNHPRFSQKLREA